MDWLGLHRMAQPGVRLGRDRDSTNGMLGFVREIDSGVG